MMNFQPYIFFMPRRIERRCEMQVMAGRVLRACRAVFVPAKRYRGLVDLRHDMTAGLI